MRFNTPRKGFIRCNDTDLRTNQRGMGAQQAHMTLRNASLAHKGHPNSLFQQRGKHPVRHIKHGIDRLKHIRGRAEIDMGRFLSFSLQLRQQTLRRI